MITDYQRLLARFEDLTRTPTARRDTALKICETETAPALAERLKRDIAESSNQIESYMIQTLRGLNAPAETLEAWKHTTPADIFERVVKAIETPRGADIATLSKYIEYGVKLIPTKPNQEGNFYQLKKDGELIKIDSLPGLHYWIEHGIERFIFIPKESNLLCFDLDRNHGDGVDGVSNFYSWLTDNGLEDIPIFKNLDGGTFPTYTTTASGGLHLYFRCMGDIKTVATIAPGVEIKYNGLNLTAGGSVKNGRAYVLHGDLKTAPYIPPPILFKLSKIFNQNSLTVKINSSKYHNYYPTRKATYTADQLLDFARKDARGGNHDTIFQMATRLKRAGYSEAETITQIEATPEHQGRNNKQDTYSCIKSIYRGIS